MNAAGLTASQRAACNRTLLGALLATVIMLFTGFAAAYLERSTSGATWERMEFPPLLLVNTFVLLLSSVALEWARRGQERGQERTLAPALALGALFVTLQCVTWFMARDAGLFVSTTAYAAFFYLLTGLHALHMVAGLIALAYASRHRDVLRFATGFWHFMGGIWLYVLLVLTVF